MPSSYDDVAHLLRRAGFGGTVAEISALLPLDLSAVVERVLTTSAAPPSAPPAIIYDERANYWSRYTAMVQFWTERMRTSPCPVAEKMTLFWHGHFCSSMEKVTALGLLMNQNQLFRSKGMGSFRDLTLAVAVDPAMLVYLDNCDSRVGNPNENFARELMELFTLGVDRYSQSDVVAAARAWTGYGLDPTNTVYQFHAGDHDGALKTFFGQTSNWNGPAIIDEITRRSGQPVCARFIATKLWTFLAYPDPTPTLVGSLASAFTASGMNITALLRAIFNRPEFYSPLAKGALVRSPIEFVVAAMRYTGVTSAQMHAEGWFAGMGQQPFAPPNVAGWHGNASWLSTAGMWRRQAFARFLCQAAIDGGFLANPGQLSVQGSVQRTFDSFGINAPSATTRSALEAYVVHERSTGNYAEQLNLITLGLLCPEFNLA